MRTSLGRQSLPGMLVLTLALSVAVPCGAAAASSVASFRTASVSSPPTALQRGTGFTVTGRVTNRGRGSGPARLSFKLRTPSGGASFAVGGAATASVRAGRTVRYRATLQVPRQLPAGDYVLVACVTRARGVPASSCRAATRRGRAAATVGSTGLPTGPTGPLTAPTIDTPAPTTAPAGDTAAPLTFDDVPTTYRRASIPVTLTAYDATGVARTHYTVGSPPATPTAASPVYDPAARPALADGQRIAYFSVDTAGNAETVRTSAAAKVDALAPRTVDDVPTTFADGPVRVALGASDTGGSGVAATYFETGVAPQDPTTRSAQYDPASPPALLDGEVVKYFSVDAAGNAEPVRTSAPAKVDATGPLTVDDVPASYRPAPVTVTLTATSRTASTTTRYTTGTAPATPTTASPVYDPAAKPVLADGERIAYFSVDAQGRREPVRTSAAAKVDTAAPTVADDVADVWTRQPVRVTLTASDTGGSGVAATYFEVGAAPASPTTASPIYDPLNKPVLLDGQRISYRATDAAGNLGAVATSRPAKLDAVAPTTVDDVRGTRSSTPQPVTLTATDAGGAGIATTYYTVGATPATPTTASAVYSATARPVLQDGERISYFSVDTAGNAEPVRTSAAALVDPTVYTAGATSLGDSLFPGIGNGGYDALHYALDLDYTIATKLLKGTATMRARATQNLSALSQDFAYWLYVSKVTVDGQPATFEQEENGYKLRITPATPIKTGTTFEVAVTYSGIEQAYIDPDGSQEGWVPSTTRGAIVVSEPVGAMGWFPNNNVPYDKATYSIRMAVPEVTSGVPWTVIGPGVLQEDVTAGGKRTMTWNETTPTASYLVGLGIGKYDVTTVPTTSTAAMPTSVPMVTAVESAFTTGKTTMLTNLARTPSILDYFSEYYGVPYMNTSTGNIVPLISVGYALETQSKPSYPSSTSLTSTGPGIGTIAHEHGHMWFGNYTTLTQWKDIWLNEGMTEFSSWLWQAERNSGTALSARFTTNYNTTSTSFWNVAPANPPTAVDIFNTSAMYTRGAMIMIGLRDIFGDARFRSLMRDYLTQPAHVYGNATTEEFIALVKAKDLAYRTEDGLGDRTARWTEFFRQWLYTPYTGAPAAGNKPQITAANFDTFTLPLP